MKVILKRGKFKLPKIPKTNFKSGIATFICADGLVYLASDEVLNHEAENLDKLPKQETAEMAKKLFSSASCAIISKHGKINLKDYPSVMEILGDSFNVEIINEGLVLLIPENGNIEGAKFFKDMILESRQ